MSKLKDLTGQKFGKLTVISFNKKEKGHYYWNCICDCGKECVKDGDRLRRLETKSCGCYRADRVTTHGKHNSRIYRIWRDMKTRCSCPSAKAYERYGGRGINYIVEWEDFEPFYNWAINNGYKEGLTLDRIDYNGNYEPKNCRWVTMKEQSRNTSKNTIITYKGESHCLSEWAEILKIKPSTIYSRLHLGWSTEKTFETPIIERKKRMENNELQAKILRLEQENKELKEKYSHVLELAKTNADSNEYCLQELEKKYEQLRSALEEIRRVINLAYKTGDYLLGQDYTDLVDRIEKELEVLND